MDRYEASPFVRRPVQERSRVALARIVAAATEVLVRKGDDGFSMAEVAEAAGIPVGNIYRRFDGKDSIVQAIKLEAIRRLEDAVCERLNGQKFAGPSEIVSEISAILAEISERDEALHRVLYSYPMLTPSLRAIGLAGRGRVFAHYNNAVSGFLDFLPEKRRLSVIGFSYQIIVSSFVSKSRGDDPILLEMSWSALAQEVTKAATGYLKEAA